MPCNSNEVEHFEIDVNHEGMKLSAHGFKGEGCVKESQPIEEAIGILKSRTKTRDFFAKAKGAMRQMLGGGR